MIRIVAVVIAAGLLLTGCGSTAPASDGDTGQNSEQPAKRSAGGAAG